jgi:hypothetical protein
MFLKLLLCEENVDVCLSRKDSVFFLVFTLFERGFVG